MVSDLDVFLQNGYGVLYVGLDNREEQTNVTVEDTAYALEALLSYVNTHRISDSKIALLGHSMGAISSRIALTNMELNSQEHNVGIYVSYDAPHRGANVPQGLQYIVPTMGQYLSDVQAALNAATSDMANMGITISLNILGNTVQSHLAALKEKLSHIVVSSVLAKQMLMQNVNGTTEFDALQTELTYRGYPQETVNVAITNGSVKGATLPDPEVNSNGAIYEFFGKIGADTSKAYLGAHFALFPTVPSTTNLTADFSWWFQKVHYVFGIPATQTITGGVPKSHSTDASFTSYDQVPGSMGNLLGILVDDNNTARSIVDITPGAKLNEAADSLRAIFQSPAATDDVDLNYTFTFIPTFSALDIPVPESNEAIIDTSLSPFDNVYVNGDGNFELGKNNISHLRIKWPLALQEQIDQIVNPLVLQEISVQEEAVIWLNHFSGDYSAMEQAVRHVFEVSEGTRLPRDLQSLVFDLAEHSGYSDNPYTSVNDVEELFGEPTPFKNQPSKIVALITYVQAQNVLDGYTNSQCLMDRTPQAICEKVIDLG